MHVLPSCHHLSPLLLPAPASDKLYAYGEITSIRINPRQKCAFVEYATHDQAKVAAEAVFGALVVKVCSPIAARFLPGPERLRTSDAHNA